jgi:hypothetical protein
MQSAVNLKQAAQQKNRMKKGLQVFRLLLGEDGLLVA